MKLLVRSADYVINRLSVVCAVSLIYVFFVGTLCCNAVGNVGVGIRNEGNFGVYDSLCLSGDEVQSNFSTLWEADLDNDDFTQGVKSIAIVDEIAYILIVQRSGAERGNLFMRRFNTITGEEFTEISVKMPEILHMHYDASAKPDLMAWNTNACTLFSDDEGVLLVARFRPSVEPAYGAQYTDGLLTVCAFDPISEVFDTDNAMEFRVPLCATGSYRKNRYNEETMLERISNVSGSFYGKTLEFDALVAWLTMDGLHADGDYTFAMLNASFNGSTIKASVKNAGLSMVNLNGQCVDCCPIDGTQAYLYERQNVSESKGGDSYYAHVKEISPITGDYYLVDSSIPPTFFNDDPNQAILHYNCRGTLTFNHNGHLILLHAISNNEKYGMKFGIYEWEDYKSMKTLNRLWEFPQTAFANTTSSNGVLYNRQLFAMLSQQVETISGGWGCTTDFIAYNPGSGIGAYRFETPGTTGAESVVETYGDISIIPQGKILTVKNYQAGNDNTLRIYDMMGRMAADCYLNGYANQDIDVSMLRAGVYVACVGDTTVKVCIR